MTFKYVNRKNLIYFLHKVEKEDGETEYFFSRQKLVNNLEQLPEGYEIVEEENGRVIIQKKK